MNDIITGEVMVDSLDFLDPRKYRKCFTQDNEPVYVPIGESGGGQAPTPLSGEQCDIGKPRKKLPDSCIYYTADDVAEMLGVCTSQAYKVIKSLNAELEKQNYIVLAGRVSKVFFHEKYYGMEKMLSQQKEMRDLHYGGQ